MNATFVTDLDTFARVLDSTFPAQHDAHVTLWRVVRRNRATAAFGAALKARAAEVGILAAITEN